MALAAELHRMFGPRHLGFGLLLVTVTFTTPIVEGAYAITSDQPGDAPLLGQFVLT